jgi:hypothetical protein
MIIIETFQRGRTPSTSPHGPSPDRQLMIIHRVVSVDRNDGPAVQPRSATAISRPAPDERPALTPSRQAPISNPHGLDPGRGTDVPRQPAVSSPEASRTPAVRARGLVLRRHPKALTGLFRQFDNRRQVAAHAGLAPTPWQSGSLDHEQGVSKAGNRGCGQQWSSWPGYGYRTSRPWRSACGSTSGVRRLGGRMRNTIIAP